MRAIRNKNVTKIQTELTYKHEIDASQARKKRKALIQRLSLFCLVAVVTTYLVISSLVSQASTLEKKQAERSDLQKELSHLKKEQEILKEEIKKLNDDDYIAKLARRDYFLSEDGEIIFNIPEKKEKQGK